MEVDQAAMNLDRVYCEKRSRIVIYVRLPSRMYQLLADHASGNEMSLKHAFEFPQL